MRGIGAYVRFRDNICLFRHVRGIARHRVPNAPNKNSFTHIPARGSKATPLAHATSKFGLPSARVLGHDYSTSLAELLHLWERKNTPTLGHPHFHIIL